MKKALFIALALIFVLGMTMTAMAGVSGTKHDPRVVPGGGPTHVCESCHTPHSGLGSYPLWNRNRDHNESVEKVF